MTTLAANILTKHTDARFHEPNAALRYLAKHRRANSFLVGGALAFLVIFGHHSWAWHGGVDMAVSSAGFILVMAGALGRLWASLYIAGRKNKTLVTEGPYSMLRNPLYFFSAIGAVGVALASENLLLLIAIAFLFALYYPAVIIAEERDLARRHPDAWPAYAERTPRFLPRLSLYRSPETITIHTRKVAQAFADAAWLPLVLLLVRGIEQLQELGVIPILFTFP